MNNLKNKLVVVTGGKGLLGSAILSEITDNGGIAINADIHCLKSLKDRQYKCDITDATSVNNLINAVLDKFGRIDGWVNNAYPRTDDWGQNDFEVESIENWKKNLEMHLGGYALCSQLILRQMKKQGGGSLINMASIYGILGPDFSIYEGSEINNPSAYAAIKGGIVNLTRYLASYYGPSGVRVNCISPGGIYNKQSQVFVQNYVNKTPLRRMGIPGDIAPSVVFLLSDAAAYITGHNLIIDGGWSIV